MKHIIPSIWRAKPDSVVNPSGIVVSFVSLFPHNDWAANFCVWYSFRLNTEIRSQDLNEPLPARAV